ncbi:MAG: SPASM domain-containing protein [Pirellulales bacterium]|nr:SPASM domain-containing protein [Pirellulales bacterium]
MKLKSYWNRCFSRRGTAFERYGLTPGLHHYLRPTGETAVRFHLRIDRSGDGLLLANAESAVRLHPSGVLLAKGLLEGVPDETLVKNLVTAFSGATAEQAAEDLRRVRELLDRLSKPGAAYPMLNLADPTFAPDRVPLERPLAADVPLCKPFYMEPILQRLWEEGIPHVTVLAPRDPPERDLLRAVEKAEDIGLITGVRGRGSDLAFCNRIPNLAQAGLDHLDVFCLSTEDPIHDVLAGPGDRKKAVKAMVTAVRKEVCPVAVVPLLRPTLATIDQTLASLAGHGIVNAGLFGLATVIPPGESPGADEVLRADELIPAAELVEDAAARHAMRLIWYPPIRFQPDKPLGEQVLRGPRTGGDTTIRVEPDGRVFAPRGPNQPAGNLLTESWEQIAESRMYRRFRHRLEAKVHCRDCPSLAVCVADCLRRPVPGEEGESEED